MVYFISDTHFGHENVIRFCNRPFASVNEMDEFMIQAWNSRVTERDRVYIMGDMFFRCENPESILHRLKGHKNLIVGNHDGSWMDKVDLNRYFDSVNLMHETNDGKRPVTLCHYPMVSWKHDSRSFMIHGHIHNDTTADFFPFLLTRDNILNAGVDINGYKPVTFDELLENNRAFKKKCLDVRVSGFDVSEENTRRRRRSEDLEL
ncbi:MAG: hypothetical protein LUG88_06020 [Clostridia bacterium]|nr:hypothetical protein [Clostridia bacterium]